MLAVKTMYLEASLALFLAVTIAHGEVSSGNQVIPDEATVLHGKLACKLDPAVRAWVAEEGGRIAKDPKATVVTVRSDVQSRFAGKSTSAMDLEAVTFMVLVETAQQMNGDLQSLIRKAPTPGPKKSPSREKVVAGIAPPKERPQSGIVTKAGIPPAIKTGITSGTSMSDTQSLRLQMAMERRSKFIEELSNVMKKISDTEDTTVQNLK